MTYLTKLFILSTVIVTINKSFNLFCEKIKVNIYNIIYNNAIVIFSKTIIVLCNIHEYL